MWLLSPQILMLVAAMALSATGGWRVTSNHYQNQIAQMELERVEAVAKQKELNHRLSVAGLELSGVISERNAARHEKVRIVEKIVYVEVIGYRDRPAPRPVDGTCYLDSEWVRIADLAASGVSGTATSTAESDAAATYADALETVTTNYATCHKLRATVIGWQEFYEALRRLRNED